MPWKIASNTERETRSAAHIRVCASVCVLVQSRGVSGPVTPVILKKADQKDGRARRATRKYPVE